LPENPAPAPPSSKPSAGKSISKPPSAALTQHLTGVTLEVPGASKQLNPAHRQVTGSRSDASPASDDKSNTARIAALENRQDELEKWMRDFDDRLKTLGA
jgi:hypothetical protein